MRLGARFVALAAILSLGAAPASAATPTLTLTGPQSFAMHGSLRLDARFTAGRAIHLERLDAGAWAPVGSGTTDATGLVVFSIRFDATSTFRAVLDGEAIQSAPVTVTGVRRPGKVTVSGTWSVVDETSRTFLAAFRSNLGEPVAGARLTVHTRLLRGRWRVAASAVTDAEGRARFVLAPRNDVRVQVNGQAGSWWAATASPQHLLDNLPGTAPVRYPGAAPQPRYLAPQARALGDGPSPVIQRIPDDVWRAMRGRSWHAGCPVGRADLRLIRINYWDFTGYRRRGELIVRADIAGRAVGALSDMYAGRFPIRRMYRVDRFGWSHVQQGADDRASMAADNTSAFNCRSVTGWPGRRSPHSYGRAIDLNPFENPFVSRAGVLPNRWWLHRSHPRIAWRSASHPVVRIWRAHGFHWTYPGSDPQHWDGRLRPGGASFVAD